jgi:hypothetical protein
MLADFRAPTGIKPGTDIEKVSEPPTAPGEAKIEEALAPREEYQAVKACAAEMCANKDFVEKAQAYLKADAKLTASLMQFWPKQDAFNNMRIPTADYSDHHPFESLQLLKEDVKTGQDYLAAENKVEEANKPKVAAENSLQAALKKAYPTATDEQRDEILQEVLSTIQENNLEKSGANKNKDAVQAPPDNSGQQRNADGQGRS